MVEAVIKDITAIFRDFESIYQKAKEFCASVNVSLHETDLEIDAVLSVLSRKRARKKKRMSDNQCPDEVVLDEVDHYRINTFNAIMARVVQNLQA